MPYFAYLNTPNAMAISINPIQKLLVANRGEIAIRIMRTCREMGIATVAVYSEADAKSLHVQYADEAVLIGPAPSAQSYLRMDAVIAAAKQTGAQAIHPGYGFLSENAGFAKAVREAGLIFVGPSEHSIEVMGSKLGAKETVKAFGIPMVPGTEGAISDIEEAKAIAIKIGFPVLIKASAGGGGKGMRVVHSVEELEDGVKRAQSEAQGAFGDSAVFIEKYVLNPKHIEIQVLGDQHGNVVHLFERDCSVQRRHQKVVEEAPSAILTPEVRQKMGQAAVNAAKACGYFSAGTVEFILDKDLNFYFLEMNTRLQVEHPVTELITGVDLVRQQIRVAEGHPLPFGQDDLHMRGHAIEIRVYAEDPANGFNPDVGLLKTYRLPQGPGIRVDNGIAEGMQIPIYYDPMLSKLIVYAEDRQAAIDKMIRAIEEYEVTGASTTLGFCQFVMEHPDFRHGWFDTGFVGQHFSPEKLIKPLTEDEQLAVVHFVAQLGTQQTANTASANAEAQEGMGAWRSKRSTFLAG